MLAFLAAALLGITAPRAQSNVEYNFRQQNTLLGDRFSLDDDEAPQLTMSCLAANGYGQWTLSSDEGGSQFPSGWYLLANGLYKPSTKFDASDLTHHPGCFPPGVVQSGSFTFPTEVKATTNLDGMSGFLSPDQTTRQVFHVSGFTASDVDLSFSFLSTPTPPMNVVNHAIHTWPTVSTQQPVGMTHDVVSEADFRDNYDWCADAHFVYIVWASTTNPLVPGQEEVWVTVVPIGSGTPAAGFPMEINDGTNFDGKFPTITCDPRKNRTGTPAPAFDIAYIQPSTSNIMVSSNGGAASALATTFWNPTIGSPGSALGWGFPAHARIVRNSVFGAASALGVYAIVNRDVVTHLASGLTLIYYDPMHLGGTADYVAGDLMAPPSPIPSTAPIHDAPIIAFADPYDDQTAPQSTDEFHCLYQYDLGSSASPAEFPICIVRSSDIAAAFPDLYPTFTPDPSTQDTRLVLNQTSGGLLWLDPHNNWYVGAINQMGIHVHWIDVNAFHFYARDMNRTFDEPIDENTLVTDQCTVSDGSVTGTNHGGTVGAQLNDNKHMAIWTDPNYGANLFDHTGNIGLWQPGDLHPVDGTIDPMVGTLNFTGNNVVLQIGASDVEDNSNAVLTDMPYFYCNFQNSSQGITIGAGGIFDYYGLIANHNSDGSIHQFGTADPQLGSPFVGHGASDNIFGAGIITLDGYYRFDDAPPYSIWYPGTLNIHGGADFGIGSGGQLQSVYEGNIQVLYDGNVYPLPPATIGARTGHATLHGTTYIEESDVEGHIPADTVANPPVNIISIRGYDAVPQFLSGSTDYSNSNSHGYSEILIEPLLKPVDAVEFDTDGFSAARIHYINPQTSDPTFYGDPGTLTVDNSSFGYQHGRSIFVESTEDPEGGAEGDETAVITIDNNYFASIDSHDLNTDPDDASHGAYGVYIKDLDVNFIDDYPDYEGTITVENNTFPIDNWTKLNPSYPTSANVTYSAAICFENTTGNILSNTIKDPAYNKGIWLMATVPTALHYTDGSPYTAPPTERTFICSNVIRDLHRTDNTTGYPALTGIRTEYHTGYIKLNNIINSEVGLWANGIGDNFMVFDSIDDYWASSTHDSLIGNAIKVTSPAVVSGNTLDLSGVHGTTSTGDDYAAKNEVRATYPDWTTGMISIGCHATLVLGNTFETWGWTQFGQNNLYLTNPGFPSPGASTQPTSTSAYSIVGICSSAAALSNVDFNFWGIDGSGNKIDPANGTTTWNGALLTQNTASNVTLTSPSNTLAKESNFAGASCGSSRALAKHKQELPQTENDSVPTGCQLSFNIGLSDEQHNMFAASYDTLKAFVQNCPRFYYAGAAFSIMSDDVQQGGNGPSSFAIPDFQHWLISALAWNPGNADYFCSDVHALMGTVGISPDTDWQEANTNTNRGMSVLHWLLQNPLCTSADDSELYINSRGSQLESYYNWPGLNRDSVPFDTTIYSMHDLGLDSVLKYAALLGVSEGGPSVISNASAYPNPAGTGTVISFGMTKEAYVIVNLYNVLGEAAGTAHFEGAIEPGNHSVPISLASLPSGTYFARIQTTYGEVESVKIVKE